MSHQVLQEAKKAIDAVANSNEPYQQRIIQLKELSDDIESFVEELEELRRQAVEDGE